MSFIKVWDIKRKVVEAQTILASKITKAIWLPNKPMKKIILVIILSMIIVPSAGASEIFGQISTNPNVPAVSGDNPPVEEPVVKPAGGAVIFPAQKKPEVRPEAVQAKPVVLGLKIYPNGSLLRGADRKIYLIQGKFKKHIASLAELKKYRGRAILKATAEELAVLATRGHLDGELIRERGEVKVYVITPAGKQHILNLAELRAHYFGREIFNLSHEEMAPY